jgi:hypothetical protein
MANSDTERVRRIEDLVRRLDEIPGESRVIAQSLMEAILELHGAGLERMIDIAYTMGDAGEAMVRRFAADDLVSSLLILHNLHPDDIETRVLHVLGKMHGNAELIGVFDGTVRLRLTGSGCGLKESLEAAVREAVPDATEIVIEEGGARSGFVPLAALMA